MTLDRVPEAMEIGRRTMRIARQSIWAGLGLSGVAMIIAAFGGLPPIAGAGDPGSHRRRRDSQRAADVGRTSPAVGPLRAPPPVTGHPCADPPYETFRQFAHSVALAVGGSGAASLLVVHVPRRRPALRATRR